ncbi:MAG: T9SS type A sorting domain-containing protein [candidate division Zixibacteria bacterium]|nr:T9SS type A sorting domain-containing protein [candidate division Zixibacteria bacterium]
MKYKAISAIIICLLLITSYANGQGANYIMTSGAYAGGGGSSGSTNALMTGSAGCGPMAVSSSTNYQMNGGFIATISSSNTFFIEYNYTRHDTITVQNQTLTMVYGNQTGAVSGSFFYKLCGRHDYTEVALSSPGANELSVALNTNMLTARGLDYYMAITDAGTGITRHIGNAIDPYLFVTQMTNATGQRPVAMPDAQYRIIGVPIDITGSRTALTVFGDDLGDTNSHYWRMARYDDGGTDDLQFYPDLDQVYPERGYWLIARSGKRYGAAGYSMQPNLAYNDMAYYRTEELAVGWNMLANPLPFAVGWDAILVEDNDVVQEGHPLDAINDYPYYYEGTGYIDVAAIPAWEGIYLYVNKAGIKLLFPNEEYVMVGKSADTVSEMFSIDNWHLDVTMTAGQYVDRLNSLGVKPEAESGRDKYDYAEPPPAPGAPHLAFVLPDEDGLFCTDYRSRIDDGAIWDVTFSSAPNRVLQVDHLEELPGDWQAWLIMNNGSKIRLEPDSPVALPDQVTSAQIIVGDQQYLASDHGATIPTHFTLYQNYPNPFNPTTIIRIALPNPSHVSLEIYNILGRKVATLINQPLQAGYHTVTWDGRTTDGKSAASGVYFYRVTGDRHIEQKKMLLLK